MTETRTAATRYEITQGREVKAWGLTRSQAVAQLREVALTYLEGQPLLVPGHPGYQLRADDEILEDGKLHLWQQGVGGNTDAHVTTWRIREDGGVATHPAWPPFAPLTTSVGR